MNVDHNPYDAPDAGQVIAQDSDINALPGAGYVVISSLVSACAGALTVLLVLLPKFQPLYFSKPETPIISLMLLILFLVLMAGIGNRRFRRWSAAYLTLGQNVIAWLTFLVVIEIQDGPGLRNDELKLTFGLSCTSTLISVVASYVRQSPEDPR